MNLNYAEWDVKPCSATHTNTVWLFVNQDCCSRNLELQWQPQQQQHHQLRDNNNNHVCQQQQHVHLASTRACCSAITFNLSCKVNFLNTGFFLLYICLSDLIFVTLLQSICRLCSPLELSKLCGTLTLLIQSLSFDFVHIFAISTVKALNGLICADVLICIHYYAPPPLTGALLPPPKKEVMFLVRSVCLSVCLFVCPMDYSKTCEQIAPEFWW